jgi:hypothetical protein
MRLLTYRLQEILVDFLEAGQFNRELKERLQEYMEGDGYRQASRADPDDPANATSHGRARTAQILKLCAEGNYQKAWEEFVQLEEYLRDRRWMNMMEGNLYRLGAWIAGRCGKTEEAARLSHQYAEYRERYVDSFEALVVQALVGLWTEPERAAELAGLLFGAEASAAGIPEWLGVMGRKAAAWVAGSLAELAPAPALAAAGEESRPAELELQSDDGRLRARVRRQARDEVWVWVETGDADLMGRQVEVRVGAGAEPRVRRRVTLEPAGGGRFGGWAFLGRWEHLGLGENPWLWLGLVEESGGENGLE